MHISSSCFFSSFLLREEKRTFTYAQGATLVESIRNPCPLQHKAETPPTRTAISCTLPPPDDAATDFQGPASLAFPFSFSLFWAQHSLYTLFVLLTEGIPPVQHSSCPAERSTVAQHLAGLRETNGAGQRRVERIAKKGGEKGEMRCVGVDRIS